MISVVAQEIARMGAAVPFAFEITFADGTSYRNRKDAPRFSMHFRNRSAEWGIAAFGHVGMLEGYIEGTIDVGHGLVLVLEECRRPPAVDTPALRPPECAP